MINNNQYKFDNIPSSRSRRVTHHTNHITIRSNDNSFLDSLLLSIFFLLLLISYASLGKNILTNSTSVGLDPGAADDPISKNIGYVRIIISFSMFAYIAIRFGLQDILKGVPWIVLPFIIWAVISCSWSENGWDTFRSAFYLVLVFFALPVIISHLGIFRMIALLLHLIAGVVILSTFVAILFPNIGTHTDTTVWAAHAGRWRGIFGHKNGLGPWAAYGTVLLFSYSWLARGPRIYWWAARVCAVACLLYAGSATSIVVAVFMITAVLCFRLRTRVSDGLICLTSMIFVATALISYIFFKELVFEILGRDDSFTGRTDVWALAIQSIADDPLYGTGYLTVGGSNFQAAVFNLIQQELPGAENAYLTAMLELGVPGLLFFFVPLLINIPRILHIWNYGSRKERAAIEVITIIIFAALLMGITESTPFIITGYDGVVTFPAVFVLTSLSTYFSTQHTFKSRNTKILARPFPGQPKSHLNGT